MKTIACLFVIVMFSLCGCRSVTSQRTEDYHEGRLQAANTISAQGKKDNALSQVALDAAKAGVGAVAEYAVNGIQANDLHDSVASRCALHLSRKGKTVEAARIAKSIHAFPLRDKTCAKIAIQ